LAPRLVRVALGVDGLAGFNPHGVDRPVVGDESALSAIAASLERVAPTARALAVVVVDDVHHRIELACPGVGLRARRLSDAT
jgi:NADPH-dependent ferric siderophore reductase